MKELTSKQIVERVVRALDENGARLAAARKPQKSVHAAARFERRPAARKAGPAAPKAKRSKPAHRRPK